MNVAYTKERVSHGRSSYAAPGKVLTEEGRTHRSPTSRDAPSSSSHIDLSPVYSDKVMVHSIPRSRNGIWLIEGSQLSWIEQKKKPVNNN